MVFYISKIAQQAAVPVKTIRYYEEVGLLRKPERTDAGYRLYPMDTVNRLQFIKKAQSLGLRLEGIKEILDLVDRGRCPCGHVQRLLTKRLKELRQKIADLKTVERRLTTATRRGCSPNVRPTGKAMCPTIQRQPQHTGGTRHGTTQR